MTDYLLKIFSHQQENLEQSSTGMSCIKAEPTIVSTTSANNLAKVSTSPDEGKFVFI